MADGPDCGDGMQQRNIRLLYVLNATGMVTAGVGLLQHTGSIGATPSQLAYSVS